ncbi:MAG: CRISPR-associated helicase Cas3', partial [Candidatus Micrarchaeota archaeon]|nr:CRISPR-associated helicase Cas3' [Candidatus Micrarchaeota archaeon]
MGVTFFSHPAKNDDRPFLSTHLLQVAGYTSELIRQIGGEYEIAYVAGLLHDVGKLNPHYQKPFSKGEPPCPDCRYVKSHSIFSAFACDQALLNLEKRNCKTMATICIYGHHSSLKPISMLPIGFKDNKKEEIDLTIKAINESLPALLEELKRDEQAKKILPKSIEIEQMDFSDGSDETDNIEPFFETSCIYSALLQADRGAVSEWREKITNPLFSFHFDTRRMIQSTNNILASYRDSYYQSIFNGRDFDGNFMILCAPTGIGKTRIFLDIVNKLASKRKFERVFYFSPLLALTEDFEDKIECIIREEEKSRILKYDHTFKGSLEKEAETAKDDYEEEYEEWNFNVESFNYQMIITTPQRLLYTLFSDRAADKIKLLSLKNSVLIIDEIQTLPRGLLIPTIKLLELISRRMNSVVIIVSATIPYEVRSLEHAHKVEGDEEINRKYLNLTKKTVRYVPNNPTFEDEKGRRLKMFNTRAEAANNANSADYYLTAGLTKKDRLERLKEIKNKCDCFVVSTQVLEAGVDVSFDQICRQLAPLDNMVQTLGRLNRECERREALLIAFDWSINGQLSYVPYGQLEFELSRSFFKKKQNTDS